MDNIIAKIISGGQTGADRGALDAALELGIDHGGFCPKGRLSEDGSIPSSYTNMVELSTAAYPVRTIANIDEADATIVLTQNSIFDKGTGLTLRMIKDRKKPFVKLNLNGSLDKNAALLRQWLTDLSLIKKRPIVINVAGPRESRVPGLQNCVREFLINVLKR